MHLPAVQSTLCRGEHPTGECRSRGIGRVTLARLTVLLAMPAPVQPAGRVSSPAGISTPHDEENILSDFSPALLTNLPIQCRQENPLVWPPFFQYNRRLLRQQAVEACFYMSHNGYWPASFEVTPPQKVDSSAAKPLKIPHAKLLPLL